jgi:hypothetical protein
MSYWYVRTGSLFYDSYINPGVGLDITSPYIFESLFSFKKGWFVYTPVMIFSVIGFFFFLKQKKEIALSFFLYFLFTSYIIFSWTEWWYGAAFSNRPLITVYPILAISLGYFIQFVGKKNQVLKSVFSIAVLSCVFLNQFQWWQLRSGILEPYRMTKDYYWATFLKTTVAEDDRKLLSVFRNFDGSHHFVNRNDYRIVSEFELEGFPTKLTREMEFSPSFEKPFGDITSQDHIWVEIEVNYRPTPQTDSSSLPLLVIHMNRKEGAYGYYSSQLTYENNSKSVTTFMTPNIRSAKDGLKTYLWNKDKNELDIRLVKIKIFEKK